MLVKLEYPIGCTHMEECRGREESPMRMPFKSMYFKKERSLKRLDPSQPLSLDMRLMIYGPIHKMNYPTLLDRLFGR